jgi:hypothetical protein
MAAGAWRDYHESIHARLRLPFVRSCTADAAVQKRTCGALVNYLKAPLRISISLLCILSVHLSSWAL